MVPILPINQDFGSAGLCILETGGRRIVPSELTAVFCPILPARCCPSPEAAREANRPDLVTSVRDVRCPLPPRR